MAVWCLYLDLRGPRSRSRRRGRRGYTTFMYSCWRPSWEFYKAGLKWNVMTAPASSPESSLTWLTDWVVTAAPGSVRGFPSCSSFSSSFKSGRGRSCSGFGQSRPPERNTASKTSPEPFLSRPGFFYWDYNCMPAIKVLNNFALDRPLISIIHSRRQTPEAARWFILFLYNYTPPTRPATHTGHTWWFTEMLGYLVIVPHSWSIIILPNFAESFAG